MSILIEIENIYKSFKDENVLRGISYNFDKGKIHGIVAFNVSGKTVLFKCICGFMYPDSGTIRVNGKVIGKDVDFPESIGAIIETPGFLTELNGFQNLRRLAALRNKIGKSEIYDAMRIVGLDPENKKKVRNYSLGMRERLGIAQAIMEQPELLILDEPFNGLDRRMVETVCDLLDSLRRKGTTILLAGHNITEIQTLSDSICEMNAGEIKRIR